jgi:hypothetical protein
MVQRVPAHVLPRAGIDHRQLVHRPPVNGSFRNRMSGTTRLKTATTPA